jgi:hypothetical protein
MFNIARVLEHEFLGHGVKNLKDYRFVEMASHFPGDVEDFVNKIRGELGLPYRVTYSGESDGKIGFIADVLLIPEGTQIDPDAPITDKPIYIKRNKRFVYQSIYELGLPAKNIFFKSEMNNMFKK